MSISIIIPIYNQSKSIGKCLESIFNQTFKDFEVIVVNDGSTDDFNAVIRPWEAKTRLFHQTNQGAPKARNFGFSKSKGEYILFCDADIAMKPDMLKKMHDLLEKKKAFAYAYSCFKMGFKKFKLWPFDAKKLRQMPYIHSTSLIRRECFPGWDENLKKFQDWDLWLTMLEKGHQGVWIPEFLFSVKSKGTMSSWIPGFMYVFPFLKSVKKYREAEKIIKQKHNI